MVNKRLGVAVLFVLLSFPVSASMVSLLIVETGLNEGVLSTRHSSLWEGGLMSAFFDAGYIVTSGPIARMERNGQAYLNGQIEAGLHYAASGGADFLVMGFIEYNTQRGRALPVSILIKLYDSNTRQLIHQQNFPAGAGRNNTEEMRHAQGVGQVIIARMKDR